MAEYLGTMILAAGAVGTAAFGIVEAFKWTVLGIWGFTKIPDTLGDDVMGAMGRAYGNNHKDLLKAQYRSGRGSGILGKTLRQGVRIGLCPDNAEKLASMVGVVDGEKLKEASVKIQDGADMRKHPDLQAIVGRFELAIDARIDAALSSAESSYKTGMRMWASVVAIALAICGAAVVEGEFAELIVPAILVGLVAVPLAPIAKDVVSGIKAASDALGRKNPGPRA